MNILCVSDTEDNVIYNERVKENFSAVEAVLCAGDLSMEYIDFIVSNLNVPAVFVFGNHHTDAARELDAVAGSSVRVRASAGEHHGGAYRAGFVNVRVPIGNELLLVAGAPGCMRYNKGDFQFTEAEMHRRLAGLVPGLVYNKLKYGRYLDIFLTHAPPAGIHDGTDTCHRGFQCFRDFVRRFTPTYLVHGHIHLYGNDAERCTDFGNTKVVNAYGHHIITLEVPHG